jgi:hypothetical protein
MAYQPDWSECFGYASPPIGLGLTAGDPGEWPRQPVIGVRREGNASSHVANRVFATDGEGNDVTVHDANLAEWQAWFRRSAGAKLEMPAVAAIVENGERPKWLGKSARRYLDWLKSGAALPAEADRLARDKTLDPFLRSRWAFQLVRSDSVSGGRGYGPDRFKELESFMDRNALSYWRAKAWQARLLEPRASLEAFLDIFERRPDMRAQVFASLMNAFTPADFEAIAADAAAPAGLRESAAFAAFLVAERDFSPTTLERLAGFDQGAGRSRTAMLRMMEQVEREAGPEGFDPLILAPAAGRPVGAYKGLVDAAERIAHAAATPEIQAFWLACGSYLCLFDGDSGRMAALLERSQTLAAEPRTADFRGVLVLLVDLERCRGRDLPAGTQDRWLAELQRAAGLRLAGDNRGLYQSLLVLLARKWLSTGRLDLAALAFGPLDDTVRDNPYRLRDDDWYWAHWGWRGGPVNYLVDALMDPAELQSWKSLLGDGPRTALQAWLARKSPLDAADLDYLTALKHLRRNEAAVAVPIAETLERAGYFMGKGHFRNGQSRLPAKRFFWSTKLSWEDPARPAALEELELPELARRLAAMRGRIRGLGAKPLGPAEGRFLMDCAGVWFNLQLTGFSLPFSDPPLPIHYVDDFDLYPYEGQDGFPLSALPAAALKARAQAFLDDEQNPGRRARALLQSVLNFRPDPALELEALAILARIDPAGGEVWKARSAASRYQGAPLLAKLRATCEGW